MLRFSRAVVAPAARQCRAPAARALSGNSDGIGGGSSGGSGSSSGGGEATATTKAPPTLPPSLEPRLVAEQPELVLSHLARRHAGAEALSAVPRVAAAAAALGEATQRRDGALSRRKELSNRVAKLMPLLRGGNGAAAAGAGAAAAAAVAGDGADTGRTEYEDTMAAVAAERRAAAEAEVAALKEQVAAVAAVAADASAAADAAEAERHAAMLQLPNLLDDRVPEGLSDADNELVYEWWPEGKEECGTAADRAKKPDALPHDEFGATLGRNGLHFPTAAKLSGARFAVLAGSLARLERALASFFLDLHCGGGMGGMGGGGDGASWAHWVETGSEEGFSLGVFGGGGHGYTEVSVPAIVRESALRGTGQLPKFEEDLFVVGSGGGGGGGEGGGDSEGDSEGEGVAGFHHSFAGERGFLIPTAEVPLTNLFAGEVLAEARLPLRLAAWTPCFRAEAGSRGRDVRGLMRQHQFGKVELVSLATAAGADGEHERLTRCAERCLRELRLPYRKVRLCGGDVGFTAAHCYDLEVWVPSEGRFREISSCSNCGDFQARRMALRYRPKAPAAAPPPGAGDGKNEKKAKKGGKNKGKEGKPAFVHTINGSGLALGRTMIAVLEHGQRTVERPAEEGGGSAVVVDVPEVLWPYMGGVRTIEPDGEW